jgi:ribonuclease P protein component
VSDNCFPKEEKLISRKQIRYLFSEGKRFYKHPINIIYCNSEVKLERGVQILIGASKKRFKKASQRNRIKRLLREAYRLERKKFHKKTPPLYVGFLYSDSKIESLAFLRTIIRESLEIVCQETKS